MRHGKTSKKPVPANKKARDITLTRMIALSVLGLLLCMVCLAGSTWAWFTASITSAPQTIIAAHFQVQVSVTDSTGQPLAAGENSSYFLKANEIYQVTLAAEGTAEGTGGYCVIKAGAGPVSYTEQFKPGEEIQLTLSPQEDTSYFFTAMWGSSPTKESGGS